MSFRCHRISCFLSLGLSLSILLRIASTGCGSNTPGFTAPETTLVAINTSPGTATIGMGATQQFAEWCERNGDAEYNSRGTDADRHQRRARNGEHQRGSHAAVHRDCNL